MGLHGTAVTTHIESWDQRQNLLDHHVPPLPAPAPMPSSRGQAMVRARKVLLLPALLAAWTSFLSPSDALAPAPGQELVAAVALAGGFQRRGGGLNLALRGGDEGHDPTAANDVLQMEPVPPNPRKVYVGNLPMSAKDEDLHAFLSSVGEVTDVALKRDKQGRCKGFAMVEYATEQAAQAAIDKLSAASFANRSVFSPAPICFTRLLAILWPRSNHFASKSCQLCRMVTGDVPAFRL